MSSGTAAVRPVAGDAQTQGTVAAAVLRLAFIAVQLGIILVLVWAFNLESPAFARVVLPLAFGGFLVHHWLPRRYQPLFFAALSFAGIAIIFGVVAGAWLVGVGLALIALCHLPIPFRARLGVIVVAAGALVAMRSTWLPTPWPGVIWPILGSMFMFRLAVYLYDLKHHGPAAPGLVLSYFFMLPNTVFLLFPIIDFQTFRRTHYDKPALGIYDEGVRWIFRGLTHLVLYRVIYQYVALSPAEVTSTAGIVQYVVGNYGLYLRVSGQFHVIVGLLHLFGFRLPETHRFFYLASSFSDMWRRINIYWKDFMQKMIYLPLIFRMKRLPETTRLVLATLVVVGVTWFLHSYQWFWLLGTWLFSVTDLMFWGMLGTFLLINILREQRRGRVRQLTAQMPTPRHAWRDAIQTAGMFTLMCCLWGFWTSPTFEDFRVVLRSATFRPIDIVAVLGTFFTVALIVYLARRFSLGAPSALAARPRWQHPLVVCALPLALFWVAGQPTLAGRVPESIQAMSQQARLVELNKAEAERLQRGYYEKLVGVNRFNGQLWEVYARAGENAQPDLPVAAPPAAISEVGQPPVEPVQPGAVAAASVAAASAVGAPAAVAPVQADAPPRQSATDTANLWLSLDNELQTRLGVGVVTMFKDHRTTTNRWGMRDKDYAKTAPSGTRRTAVLGPSYVMGSGVSDGEPFEQIVEDRLNSSESPVSGLHFEFLNFAVPDYSLVQQAIILSNGRVAAFEPDVVLLIGHTSDMLTVMEYVWKEVTAGRSLPAPADQWVRESGIDTATSQAEALRRLTPHAPALTEWALSTASAEAHRMGAVAVYAMIPIPATRHSPADTRTLLGLARNTGFLTIDMDNVFQGQDEKTLRVSPRDNHPNAEGHRIIAERLQAELAKVPGALARDTDADAARKAEARAALKTTTAVRETEWAAKEARVASAKPMGPWLIESRRGTAATLSTDESGSMRVVLTLLPQQIAWHVKLRRAPILLTEGRDYRITFRARADTPRPMGVGAESNGMPSVPLGFYKTFDAGPKWQTYEWTFTASRTESNTRIFFDLGASAEPVELAGVKLRDMATGKNLMPVEATPVKK